MKNLIIFLIAIVSIGSLVGISHAQLTEKEIEDYKKTGALSFNLPSTEKDEFEESKTGAISEVPIKIKKNPKEFKFDKKKRPVIFVQLILRDSDGNLLGYLESKQSIGLRPGYFSDFVEDKKKKIIEKDGKEFLLIQWKGYEPPASKKYSMAMYTLMARIDGKATPLVWMNHDAYQVEPGDQLEVFWTVLQEI